MLYVGIAIRQSSRIFIRCCGGASLCNICAVGMPDGNDVGKLNTAIEPFFKYRYKRYETDIIYIR